MGSSATLRIDFVRTTTPQTITINAILAAGITCGPLIFETSGTVACILEGTAADADITCTTVTDDLDQQLTYNMGDGTFKATGAVTLDEATTFTWTMTAATTIDFDSTVTISGAGIAFGTDLAYTLDIEGATTISAGTFNAPDGTGTWTQAGDLHLNGATFNHNDGELNFDGACVF